MKNRILLVFDDFNESEKWQNLLQKMGFIVESIRNEAALVAQLLSLRPDAVFIMGQGRLLNPIRVLERLKNQSWFTGKVLIFDSPHKPINPIELQGYPFDGLLTSQDFSQIERLEIVSQVLNLDFEFLYKKYVSTLGSHTEPLDSASRTPISNHGSSSRGIKGIDYYLARKSKKNQNQSNSHGFNKQRIDAKLGELIKKDDENSHREHKREFVRALFKKS